MAYHETLLTIFELLNEFFGDLHWWPADSPFEMMVGAILTQNTSWMNVTKSIKALRMQGLLVPEALLQITESDLASIIRSSGYYNLKASRLKSFTRFFINEYSGNVSKMKTAAVLTLRKNLLAVKGIGPETADSILLYACQKPVFVVDAYTRRICLRHGLINESADYNQIQALFMNGLPQDVCLFNQFHALIVNTGKYFCRKTPVCTACPLSTLRIAQESP